MKLWCVMIITLLSFIDPGDIAKINSLKAEAKAAFKIGDFKTAVTKYKYLVDSLGVTEDEVKMNLSNAYFRLKDTANAYSSYQALVQSKDTKIRSLSNMQLGVLANRGGKFEDALNYFKQALKIAPDNEDARYNYELVKKKLDEKKKEQEKKDQKDKQDQDKKDPKDQKDKKDQNQKDKKEQEKKEQEKKDQEKKDQEKKDQEEKDKKDKKDKDQQDKDKKEKEKQDPEKDKKEGEKKEDKDKDKKDIPPSVSQKLKDMQMSEQKAKMILEAMKNQEVQYLQQNKRKATKPKEAGKPDW
jgi:Ca-activated chloride channel homolog